MTGKAPLLDPRHAADVAGEVADALHALEFTLPTAGRGAGAAQAAGSTPVKVHWVGRRGGFGWTLTQLFGHLSEQVINRLNLLPEKHLLAFLNEAGIEPLPPEPAHTDVVFNVGPDAPAVIRVPAGTQVATRQTETRPEIVFETLKDCDVIPTALKQVVVIDPVRRTTIVPPGGSEPARPATAGSLPLSDDDAGLAVFEGQLERERLLYLGDLSVFAFPDATSRAVGSITLQFVFATPGAPQADGNWEVRWEYLRPVPPDAAGGGGAPAGAPAGGAPADAALAPVGATWEPFPPSSVVDRTANFSQNGEVVLTDLAELGAAGIGAGVVAGRAGQWIACRLTGGNGRAHLPEIGSITVQRRIYVDAERPVTVPAAALTAIQVNSAFVPLKPEADFMPFGPRPDRFDAFYVRADEAFTKPGATVTLDFAGLTDLPESAQSKALDDLTVVWEYGSAKGWLELGRSTRKGFTSTRLDFVDTTSAFTKSPAADLTGFSLPQQGPVRSTEEPVGAVSFRVPTASEVPFAPVEVNGAKGCWVRARIAAGSYGVPASAGGLNVLTGTYEFREPQIYPPLVRAMTVSYGNYRSVTPPRRIESCVTRVDQTLWDHTPELATGDSFAAFQAPSAPGAGEEASAFYLAFDSIRQVEPGQPGAVAFPPNAWVQLLLDVAPPAVTGDAAYRKTAWEYWTKDGWKLLQAADDTHDLRFRGYLGFFGPSDHARHSEFGLDAFWLRCRGHTQKPVAEAGASRTVVVDAPEGDDASRIVQLDASASQAFDGQYIAEYEWRLVKPEAASDFAGASPASAEGEARPASPRLHAIWLNSAPAQNRVSIENEVLTPVSAAESVGGSANASVDRATPLGAPTTRANQFYALQRRPVLPDIELQVREEAAGGPEWVTWQRIDSFFQVAPSTDGAPKPVFVLDQIEGRVQFGDGRRGRIPPAGLDNIVAARYRTHNGKAGNVAAGEVSVIRNPAADVALIAGVTNPEPAVGGTDAETTQQIRDRGPQLLKHRRQAVTSGGFAWIAREASTEIAQVFVLPASNLAGELLPGSVSVVVVPEASAAADRERPMPGAALLRDTQARLEANASNTLTVADRAPGSGIFLTGPEYIEARVLARVVAQDPTQAGDVEIRVQQRLKEFVHPLRWPLGRDVYLGDIYAEIEGVAGVDHVAFLELSGSIEQHNLILAADRTNFAAFGFAAGEPLVIQAADDAVLVDGLVMGSAAPDRLDFVDARGPLGGSRAELLRCWSLASQVEPNKRRRIAPFNLVLTEEGRVQGLRRGYVAPFALPAGSEVSTFDRRVRLRLADNLVTGDALAALPVYGFKVGDDVRLVRAATDESNDIDIAPLVNGATGWRVARVENAPTDATAAAGAVGKAELAVHVTVAPLDPGAAQRMEAVKPKSGGGAPSSDKLDAVMSLGGDLRLPVRDWHWAEDWAGGDPWQQPAVLEVHTLGVGSRVCLFSGERLDPRLMLLPVAGIALPEERIIVPEGHLVVSGPHKVEMALDVARTKRGAK